MNLKRLPVACHPWSLTLWLRVAAVFLGCVFLAGVAFAAMTRLGWIRSPFVAEKPEVAQRAPVMAVPRDTASTADSLAPKQETKKPAPVVKVFDNTTLSDILSAMGQYYGLKVVYSTATATASSRLPLHVMVTPLT